MSYIKFTRYEQIWQTREVIWGETEWEVFKAQCKEDAERPTFCKEYFINIYNAVKDMSFDIAIQEYQKWRDGDEDNCIMIANKSYNVPLGALIQEALADATREVEAQEQSICDSNDYIDIHRD